MHSRRGGGGHRSASSILTALMLFRQLQQLGIFERGRKLPLATLSLAGAAFGLYFFEDELIHARLMPRALYESAAAILPRLIWHDPVREWPRLFLAALRHGNEYHMYYNVMSLLWKGVQLEDRWGTPRFAATAVALTGASHALMVVLSAALHHFDATRGWSDFYSSAVGMSALLFALKVIIFADPALAGSHSQVAGGLFSVSIRWAAWAELIFVQLLMPNVSFLGHLSGILTGLAYVALVAPYAPPPQGGGRWAGGGDDGDDRPSPFAPLLAPFVWLMERASGAWINAAQPGEQPAPPPRRRFNHSPEGYVVGGRHAAAAAGGAGADNNLRRRGAGASVSASPPRTAAAAADRAFVADDRRAEGFEADPDVQLSGPRASAPPMPSEGVGETSGEGVSTHLGSSMGRGAGAGPGAGAVPVVEGLTSGPPYYYAEMHTLWSMGFRDRRANLIALKAARGNIDSAISALV